MKPFLTWLAGKAEIALCAAMIVFVSVVVITACVLLYPVRLIIDSSARKLAPLALLLLCGCASRMDSFYVCPARHGASAAIVCARCEWRQEVGVCTLAEFRQATSFFVSHHHCINHPE